MQFDHVAQQVPDIAEAVEWQLRTVPGSRVLHQDATWALVESAGAKLAFVLPDQHPSHLAYRVEAEELERLAAEHGATIATHRDATRSIYIEGPGALATEIIAYPEGA
ncbi:MAG TPA: VOC family protein [Miltoncostaea sp.]|nr:VOC family protein [Miltoncostaea sp.]